MLLKRDKGAGRKILYLQCKSRLEVKLECTKSEVSVHFWDSEKAGTAPLFYYLGLEAIVTLYMKI